MAFVYAEPGDRAHASARAASRQFIEGDVHTGGTSRRAAGRTRFSDDLVWLPFVADHYVRVTGDVGIWDDTAAYFEMRVLQPHEHEVYDNRTA